uniref:VWFA domain-containing protein n=1 Tax=Cyprinodon variegatus TaxID=28743 RepID=A0A3Q2DYV9_CYPVA
VAVVQYSDTAQTNFNLNRYGTKHDVLQAINSLTHKGGQPINIGSALQYVRDHAFTPEAGSRIRQGAPQILILLSGGRSADDVRNSVRELKEMGVTIVAIGSSDADTLELQTISHEPRYALSVADYGELPAVKQNLGKNRTQFMFFPAEKTVLTTNWYSKKRLTSTKRDIVFLIDGSDDVRSQFISIRKFIANLVQNLDLDQQRDQIAVVQYSNNAKMEFSLDAYSTKGDVLQHVARLQPKGGRPQYIGAALQFVKDNVFVPKAGARINEGASQVLFVLAGGRSRDSPRGPARALKRGGVVIFAIGSRLSSSAEMQAISDHAFSIPDFVNLTGIQQHVLRHLTAIESPKTLNKQAQNK